MRFSIFVHTFITIVSKLAFAETIQIHFTEHDTYSIEVADINVGDMIEWLPKNKDITWSIWEVQI